MATIREAVRNRLIRSPAVAAITPNVAPVRTKQRSQTTSITYQRTGGGEGVTLGGLTGQLQATFRLDCWSAASEAEAQALALAAKGAWDGYRGGESGLFVQYAKVRDASDNPADPAAGDDVGAYCESLELFIVYQTDL